MHKLFAAAIVGSVALTSVASAQTTVNSNLDQSFHSLLAEARTKTPSISESATINNSLAAADWYWNRDAQGKAVDYLNFARGKLGLSLLSPDVTVAERTAPVR